MVGNFLSVAGSDAVHGLFDDRDSMQTDKPNTRWQRDEARWSSWMAASQRGDQSAYRELLSEIGDALEAYLQVHFGRLSILEDCVQEALLAVHNARHTYNPKRSFRPWLFTIARHKTIDILRRAEGHKRSCDALLAEPQDGAHQQDLSRMIDGAKLLAVLSEEHRQALALTKYQGMTTDEAAKHLGISEPALKARLRRGLKQLQQQWEQQAL